MRRFYDFVCQVPGIDAVHYETYEDFSPDTPATNSCWFTRVREHSLQAVITFLKPLNNVCLSTVLREM